MPAPSVGLFNTVLNSPASAPYAVGWALILMAILVGTIYEQLKAATGGRADHGSVIMRAVLAAFLLAPYTFLARATWWAAQTIALQIYPDAKLQALGKFLGILASRFRDYHFSVLELGTGIRDGLVLTVGLASWLLTLLAHSELEQIQVVVFNVIFVFGPLLIGLSAFGLSTARIWITSLLAISSWSITVAVIYRSVEDQLVYYAGIASQDTFLQGHYWDVVQHLVFISSLMFIVPSITGLLLGVGTLAELGRVNMGATLTTFALDQLHRFQPDGPHAAASPTRAAARPGDAH